MIRLAASILLLAISGASLTACGKSDDEKCKEYRQYISQGSPSDSRDIRNGTNPCY